jgi:hypothetical protein
MDVALGLVESYLRLNGYFTVAEYPIMHHRKGHGFSEVTDIDILASRQPHAGRVLPRSRLEGQRLGNDPLLDVQFGRADMILAEVKEGTADLNAAWHRPPVLYEAMRRFGLGSRRELRQASKDLAAKGEAMLQHGARVRTIVFASRPAKQTSPAAFIPLAHVFDFMHEYIDRRQRFGDTPRYREPTLAWLALQVKAGRRPTITRGSTDPVDTS